MKRNKKIGKQMREREIVNCCNKLKKDYMNYFDYVSFFEEEYEIIDNKCRDNLKQISKKLVEVEVYPNDEL